VDRTHRLPVAPRPFRDETLASWVGRIASRYGMSGRDLAADVASKRRNASSGSTTIDRLARACGVDPARVARLRLSARHLDRPSSWWLPSALAAICPDCLDEDRRRGRDGYLRSGWRRAEATVCPRHRRLLIDDCPACGAPLGVVFTMQDGRAAPACAACEVRIEPSMRDGGGEGAVEGAPVDILRRVERAIALRIRVGEATAVGAMLNDLWAPLDEPNAARPVLALCFDTPGWRCPVGVKHVIGQDDPLRALRLHWRIATLLLLADLAGPDLQSLDRPTAWAMLLKARGVSRRVRRTASLINSDSPVSRITVGFGVPEPASLTIVSQSGTREFAVLRPQRG
jgi:hypothetical protein